MNKIVRLGTTEKLTIGVGAAVATTGITGNRTLLIASTHAVYIAVGAAPTATDASVLVPASMPLLISVSAGEKVSALGTATGVTSVTEVQISS